jgi:hypothetical protein
MIVLRWLALAIAALALWDPAVRASRPQGAQVSVDVDVAPRREALAHLTARRVARALADAGFQVNTGAPVVARAIVTDHAPRGGTLEVPLWAVDVSDRRVPNVAIRSAAVVRAGPDRAAEIRVAVDGAGVAGGTTTITLEQHGIVVASARHTWDDNTPRWDAVLRYLPPRDEAPALLIRASALPAEVTGDDNTYAVRLPSARRPARVLSYDARVTWPAVFVRRSLEGEPAFALSALQRPSQGIATRAGAPPASLSNAALEPYDAVMLGGPDDLTARDVEVLRWFVEERGGVAVVIAEQRPTGPLASLVDAGAVEHRALETPVAVDAAGGERLQAAELLVARQLPRAARPLATVGTAREPVAFVVPRRSGSIVFFGALDAWRYRASDRGAYARFWRRVLSEAVLAVPPRLELDVNPVFARVGERIRIRARLRGTELTDDGGAISSGPVTARAVGPAAHVDEIVRLNPLAEPGAFEGEWHAPTAGEYDVSVARGDARADTSVVAQPTVERGAEQDPDGLAIAVGASGGAVETRDRADTLVSSMRARFPPQSAETRLHPMRSPWWMLAFAGALCVEWGWRRARGAR